jgi:hypothetical protein
MTATVEQVQEGDSPPYFGSVRWWVEHVVLCLIGVLLVGVGSTALEYARNQGPLPGWDNSVGSWIGMVVFRTFFLVDVPLAVLGFVNLAVLAVVLPAIKGMARRSLAVSSFAVLGLVTAQHIGASGQLSVSGLAVGVAIWATVGAIVRLPGQAPLGERFLSAGIGLWIGIFVFGIPELLVLTPIGAILLIRRGDIGAAGWFLVGSASLWTIVMTDDLLTPMTDVFPGTTLERPLMNYIFATLGWIQVIGGAALIALSLVRRMGMGDVDAGAS